MTPFLDVLPLAVLGAVLGLDFVSFPQAMVSRPVVAATAAGILLGRPADGLVIGALLELVALGTLPFGAARYPEWGSAAVAAGGIYAGIAGRPGALAFGMLAGLGTALLSSWSLQPLRRRIARRATAQRERLEAGDATLVAGLQLFGLSADALRAALVTTAGVLAFRPLAHAALDAGWHLPALDRAVPVGLAATVALAAVWNVTHLTKGARWYLLGGLLAGAVLAGSLR